MHSDVAALLERSDATHAVNEYEVSRERFEQATDGWLAAGAVVRNPDGAVAFVEPAWSDGWVLPGGGVEPGESIREAAAREVREETGLDVELGEACRVVEQVLRCGGDESRGWFVVFAAATPDREFGPNPGVHDAEIDRVAWFSRPPEHTPEFVNADALLGDCGAEHLL